MSLELLQCLMTPAERQKELSEELQLHSTLDVFGAAATLDASSTKTKIIA